MTCRYDCALPNEILEEIAEQGLDYLPELIRVVINVAMKAERHRYLGVAPYERSEQRRDHADGLTVFAFPEAHRCKLRTNNSLERLSREIGRRTELVSLFPNEAACLRLVSALLMEQDEDMQRSLYDNLGSRSFQSHYPCLFPVSATDRHAFQSGFGGRYAQIAHHPDCHSQASATLQICLAC